MRKMRISIMTTVMALILNGIGPERSAAEIVKAYCTLTWEEHKPGEKGDCDFRQAFGNVQVWMGQRWLFDFPDSERGRSYLRENTKTGIIFTRKGQYTLKVTQSGRPTN